MDSGATSSRLVVAAGMNVLSSLRPLLRPRGEVYAEATENRQFNALYLLMLVLSCLISLLGLLVNSPAVIIGAMLISPLMGPTLACGLALTLADASLARKAGLNVALSVAEAVFVAVVATALSPLKVATPEILARTQPNLMDLLVAFFSGLAGTLAGVSGRPGFTILPGVAIATAVMPPLAITGYGLSTAQWGVARGAFMLFFTNLTAIIISAEVGYLMAGFRPRQGLGEQEQMARVRRRVLASLAILVILSVPLMRTLVRAAQQARLRRDARAELALLIAESPGRRLDHVELRTADEAAWISASVSTDDFIDPGQVSRWERTLSARLGEPFHLELQQIQLARDDRRESDVARNYLAARVIQPAESPSPPPPDRQLLEVQRPIQDSLDALLRPAGMTPQVLAMGAQQDGTVSVFVISCGEGDTGPAAWQVASRALAGVWVRRSGCT
jgi:uncharacterized hydrophobic protein (TIGR00271 family)